MRINFSELIKQTTFQELRDFYETELKSAFSYEFSEKDYLKYLTFYKNKA